jgi:formylglycine-generating enzyme required for sulfatase activity
MKTRKTKSTILNMLLLTMAMLCVMSCNKSDDPNNGGNEGGDTPEPGEVIDGPDLMTFTVNGVSFDMIKVEGGTFWMGAQSENENGQNYDNEANDVESPVHQVALSDYYIGKYEVTQELWLAVMGTNPSHFQGNLLPVENVGPNSIKDFLSTLNERLSQETNGLQFRLPSEAQWEFAAKGGKESYGDKYSGSNILSIVAWYNQNANEQTHPVGAKEPNELFIYDMSGNVAEWCQDYVGGYVGVPQTDPIGPSHEFITGVIGDIKGCIVRGGAWSTNAQYCRSSSRAGWLAGDSSIGFRVVLSRSAGQASVPGVRTGEIDDITTNSVCVRGGLVSDGGMYPTEWGFCYGTSPNLATNGTYKSVSEFGNSYSFSDTLVNLQQGTNYYVCAYAKNEVGIGYGEIVELTTLENIRITTSTITNISNFSAVGGGNVISDGGLAVTERGLCWSTTSNPTIEDHHFANGSGLGSYSVNIMGVFPATLYYVRAYAINSLGIAYGNEVSFNTLPNNGQAPTGAINGKFTVNENGDKVYFSKGNLQYQASTGIWRFAENQWDYIGSGNANISSTYSGWIDLFGWGTSGWNSGASCYQPYDYNSQGGYGPLGYADLTGEYANADWGVYNRISNGDDFAGIWRTLTASELVYVVCNRPTLWRFAKAIVYDTRGLILFPDNWDTGLYNINGVNDGDEIYSCNIISPSDWSDLEAQGAVFLPAAGYRNNKNVYKIETYGEYWTSSYLNNGTACILYFTDGLYGVNAGNGPDVWMGIGHSVRLVRPAE